MKNRDILNNINAEMNNITVPDVLDKVKCNSVIITKADNKKSAFFSRRKLAFISSLAMILLAVILPLQIYIFNFDTAEAATVTIDINPSIELSVNSDGDIISATAINSDAEEILNNINLKRKSLDKAIKLIMEETEKENYDNTTILYNIDTANSELKGKFKEKIDNNTENYYKNKNKNGEIIWSNNSNSDNAALKETAHSYNISKAKLIMINDIISEHPEYTVEDLAPLSIRELARIRNN